MSALTEAVRVHGQTLPVQIARAQGMAYVWGRQDAGDGAHDTGPSVEFGRVTEAVKALWQAECLTGMSNIHSTYLEWRATRRVLVTLTTANQRGVFAVYCPGEFDEPRLAPVPWTGDYLPHWSERRGEPVQHPTVHPG